MSKNTKQKRLAKVVPVEMKNFAASLMAELDGGAGIREITCPHNSKLTIKVSVNGDPGKQRLVSCAAISGAVNRSQGKSCGKIMGFSYDCCPFVAEKRCIS